MAPSSEQIILGILVIHPDWLDKCDIPKGFFKTEYQQLIFREIIAGAKDAGNIVQRIEKRKPGSSDKIFSYLSECAVGVPTMTFEGLQQMIQDVKKDRLELQVESEFKEKPVDHTKVKKLYAKIDSLTDRKKPELETFYEFLNRDIPDRKILADPILAAQEIVMLHGIPKIGKTITILNIAKSLVAGQSWLDFEISEPVYPILIIQVEVADSIFKIRVENMFSDPELSKKVFMPLQNKRIYITEKEGQATIASLIKDIRPKAVFLDPYEKFFQDEEIALKNPRPFFDFFQEQIDLYGFTLLFVHHDAKFQEGKIGGQRALGSTSISASTDSNWNMRRILDAGLTSDDFNRTVELSFESRNWQPRRPLILQLNDNYQFDIITLPKSSVDEWDITEEIKNAGGQIEQKELIKKYRSAKMFYIAKNKALKMELIDEIRLETIGNPRLLMLKK